MRSDFFIASLVSEAGAKSAEREGSQMRITHTSRIMKNAEIMALLCAFAQVALAVGLFWALKGHIV